MLEDPEVSETVEVAEAPTNPNADVQPKRETLSFLCCLCGMHEFYTHYGTGSKARDSKLEYREEVFMLRNPFLPADAKPDNCLVPFLVLGGTCSECDKTVCVDPSCSIFYHKRSRDSARRIVSTMSSSMPQMPRRKRDVMHLDRARYLEQSFVVMRDELEKSLAAQQNSLRIAYEMVAEMRRWKEYLEYQSRNPARVTFTLDPRTPRHEEPNRNRPMDYGGSNQQSLCHLGPGPNFRNDSSMRAKDASDVWYADSSIQFPSRNGEPR